MTLYKFDPDDILINRLVTAPQNEFIGYSGSLYLNNRRHAGKNIPTGSLSLFELNVDRPATDLAIHSLLVKDGSRMSFRGVTHSSYSAENYGTEITGAYPLTSSIARDFIPDGRIHPWADTMGLGPGVRPTYVPHHTTDTYFNQSKQLLALRSTLKKYEKFSNAFVFSGSDETTPPYLTGTINLISIPSIFYGASIEKGSVSLKFTYSGSLLDEATDERQNGELISRAVGSSVSGTTVGVVAYDEGFILLYNDLSIDPGAVDSYTGHSILGLGSGSQANWTYFMSQSTGSAVAGAKFPPSASHFSLSFKGKNSIPTMTMFANAPIGHLNNSQNPTWISSSHATWRSQAHFDSSSYVEPKFTVLKNTAQSVYKNHKEEFEKQTFISKIGIYDEDRNLIAIAKLATPVLKRETDSYTFKLKLDM